MKFREKFIRFMMGRNGMDQLNLFLFWVYLAAVILGIFFAPLKLVALFPMVLLLWRTFSKNLIKRREENRKYLGIAYKVKSRFTLQKRRWAERKTHRYRKCPHCKATVRLPYKKGNHTVCCPKCRKDFKVKI